MNAKTISILLTVLLAATVASAEEFSWNYIFRVPYTTNVHQEDDCTAQAPCSVTIESYDLGDQGDMYSYSAELALPPTADGFTWDDTSACAGFTTLGWLCMSNIANNIFSLGAIYSGGVPLSNPAPDITLWFTTSKDPLIDKGAYPLIFDDNATTVTDAYGYPVENKMLINGNIVVPEAPAALAWVAGLALLAALGAIRLYRPAGKEEKS